MNLVVAREGQLGSSSANDFLENGAGLLQGSPQGLLVLLITADGAPRSHPVSSCLPWRLVQCFPAYKARSQTRLVLTDTLEEKNYFAHFRDEKIDS